MFGLGAQSTASLWVVCFQHWFLRCKLYWIPRRIWTGIKIQKLLILRFRAELSIRKCNFQVSEWTLFVFGRGCPNLDRLHNKSCSDLLGAFAELQRMFYEQISQVVFGKSGGYCYEMVKPAIHATKSAVRFWIGLFSTTFYNANLNGFASQGRFVP